MIIELSVAVIALAFAALVIYLIAMFKSIQQLIHQMNQTLIQMRTQVNDLSNEAKKTIEQTNHIGVDITKKIEAFNPLFNALENVGDILENKSEALKHKMLVEHPSEHPLFTSSNSKTASASAEELNKLAGVLELVGMGVSLWQKLKKRRGGS